LNAIRDSLSELASQADHEDEEDKGDDEDDPELAKLSDGDEPGWVLGTISKMVQHRVGSFRQKHMKLDLLTQPGWRDVADYFHQRDKKNETTEWNVPDVVQPQMEDVTAPSAATTFGERMEILESIPRKVQMQQRTSCPSSCHMRPAFRKPRSKNDIPSLQPVAAPDLSPIQKSKPVEHVRFSPCLKRP